MQNDWEEHSRLSLKCLNYAQENGGATALSIMTFNVMTLSIKGIFVTLSIHYAECCHTECCYDDCRGAWMDGWMDGQMDGQTNG